MKLSLKEPRRNSVRRVAVGCSLVAWFALESGAGCASMLSLDDRPCPCAAGHHCCVAIDRCFADERSCPEGGADSMGGSGGSAGTLAGGAAVQASAGHGGSSTSTGSGAVGADADAGNGGDSVSGDLPPRWQLVGEQELSGWSLLGAPDLELDSKGTPFVAFRSCDACDSALEPSLPVVLHYDGAVWQQLSSAGTAATIANPSLSIITEGEGAGLRLLVQRTVSAFDGDNWTPVLEVLPAAPAPEPAFVFEGSLFAAVYEPSARALSVLRSDGRGWRSVGSSITADTPNARLGVQGDALCLARIATANRAVIECFDGVGWGLALEDTAEAVEIAVASTTSLYAALQTGFNARILGGSPGELRELGTFPSVDAPRLALAADKTLYAAYLPDGFVNLSRFDGATWELLRRETPARGSSIPALRIATIGARQVPYLAYLSGSRLVVEKYE